MPRPAKVPDSTLVTVFEAANDARRELYVGLTTQFVGQFESELRKIPELAHWGIDEPVTVRSVEYSIPMRDAMDFAHRYARSQANAGWETIIVAVGPRPA